MVSLIAWCLTGISFLSANSGENSSSYVVPSCAWALRIIPMGRMKFWTLDAVNERPKRNAPWPIRYRDWPCERIALLAFILLVIDSCQFSVRIMLLCFSVVVIPILAWSGIYTEIMNKWGREEFISKIYLILEVPCPRIQGKYLCLSKFLKKTVFILFFILFAYHPDETMIRIFKSVSNFNNLRMREPGEASKTHKEQTQFA